VTRNPKGPKAEKLIEQLGEDNVVFGDNDDVDSLTKAMHGCYGAFFLTNYMEHFNPAKEIQQLHNMADAAQAAGVQLVVNSTGDETRPRMEAAPLLNGYGDYKVPFLDCKGSCKEYISERVPTIHMLLAPYFENLAFYDSMKCARQDDGTYLIRLPFQGMELPWIALEDVGKCVAKLFEHPEYAGQTFGTLSEYLSAPRMQEIFERGLGATVVFDDLTFEGYKDLGFPGSDQLANMMQYFHDNEEYIKSIRDRAKVEELIGESTYDLEHWLADHKAYFGQ